MKPILVNCQKVDFSQGLGVSHFTARLCSALRHDCRLIFVMPDIPAFEDSPARGTIEEAADDVVSFEAAARNRSLHGDSCIELLPHHFQEARFSDLSVIICHDLHVFDIGWKYNQVAKVRESFRSNLLAASVVLAYFPRTYYAVEAIADITLPSLFLIDSPLLLDTTRPIDIDVREKHGSTAELIYPAQLQRHKNHGSLIQAVSQLKADNEEVRITCPGTTFDEAHTAKLTKLRRECGVEQEVIFAGRLSDDELRRLYWECDGVIVPSGAEGGAYVALEAIAAGVPVAVNEIESARQHLRAVAGDVMWFDATSVGDTARAIRGLARADKSKWLEANETARKRISEMTWDKVAAKLVLLFRWLSGEGDRPIVQVDSAGWQVRYEC
jgi:glycosyltransferase involved in cell wall biosynthesis